tara:strand:+ start:1955 stop:2710 length:756 start_codon:yes stop_codon:yes gene_type:complete
MSYPKIYNKSPQIGDYVSIIITDNKTANSLPILLPDYGLVGIIPTSSLTKKRRVRSIKKFAPCGKILPAIIESTDREIIVVSRLNLNNSSDKYKKWEDRKSSSRVINSLVQYFIQKEISEEEVLSSIIYPLLELNNTEINDFDFIKQNYKSIDLDKNLTILLHNYMKSTNFVKKIEYKTIFGLAALSSISDMVSIIKPVVEKYSNLKIILIDYPKFTIKSDSNNSKQSDHNDFLNALDLLENKNFVLKKDI